MHVFFYSTNIHFASCSSRANGKRYKIISHYLWWQYLSANEALGIDTSQGTRTNCSTPIIRFSRCIMRVFLLLPYLITSALPLVNHVMLVMLTVICDNESSKYWKNIRLFKQKKVHNHKQLVGPFVNYNRLHWICYQEPTLIKVNRAAKFVVATVLSTGARGPVFSQFGQAKLTRCPLLKIFMNPESNSKL